MGLSIVQVQGRLALTDDSGNVLAVFDDSGDKRLMVQALLKAGHGLATESTLALIKDTDGIKKIVDALPTGSNLLGKVKLRNPGDTADIGDATNPVRTDPTGTTTQPISAATLPLPTGAATSAKQPALGTAGTPSADVISVQGVSGGTPQPISAASLPLPTGAATETTLAGIKTGTDKIPTSPSQEHVTAASPHAVRLSDGAAFYKATTPSDTQPVSGPLTDTQLRASAVPVSGPLTDTQLRASAVPVSAASLPLPTGAATETTLAGIKTGTDKLVTAKTADFDTGAGVDTVQMHGIALPASGGAVIGGTATNPLRMDPTGTTTQPTSNVASSQADGHSGTLGATTDADTTNTVIGRLKKIVGLLAGGLPAALTGSGSLKTAVVEAIVAGTNEIGKVAQGTAAALSGAWPAKITDGTNLLPTADVAARALYARLTDGTNTIGTLANTLHADPNGDRRTIHSNATITTSGSTVVTWNGHSEWYLIINLKNAPTGTTPGIQFFIDQVDPLDQTTVLTGTDPGVKSDSSAVLTSAGVVILELTELVSDAVKISWTVTGTSPSFTGVNVAWCGHGPGNGIEGQAEEGTALHDGPVPIAGVDGSRLVRACKVDSAGNLLVNSASAGGSNGFAYGQVTTSATTNVVVRATTYTEQSSNAQRSVSSANVNDTSAGTGARTIKITYYDSTGAGPYTEVLSMNGTTAVPTVNTNICYIEKIEVLTAGSGGQNAGIISLFVNSSGGGGTIGTIAAGDNRTYWAHHYVPTGLTCNITGMTGNNNNSSNQSLFSIRSKNLATANSVEVQISDTLLNGGAVSQAERSFGAPLQIAGPASVSLWVSPLGTPTIINRGSFDFYDQ